DRETSELLEIAFELAQKLEVLLLVGVLKRTAPEMKAAVEKILDRIRERTGEKDTRIALAKARVCGFTVCAPAGKDLTEKQLEEGLNSFLELGLPTAIYQLPQVTGNELSPELVSRLAEQFQNFLLFKDSSGEDRVLTSGKEL